MDHNLIALVGGMITPMVLIWIPTGIHKFDKKMNTSLSCKLFNMHDNLEINNDQQHCSKCYKKVITFDSVIAIE